MRTDIYGGCGVAGLRNLSIKGVTKVEEDGVEECVWRALDESVVVVVVYYSVIMC